jgi:hypothetical protein
MRVAWNVVPVQVSVATSERQRAFTLLVKTYDGVRRALTYLRWEMKDVEKFAPSLWTGRGRRTDLAAKAWSGSAEPRSLAQLSLNQAPSEIWPRVLARRSPNDGRRISKSGRQLVEVVRAIAARNSCDRGRAHSRVRCMEELEQPRTVVTRSGLRQAVDRGRSLAPAAIAQSLAIDRREVDSAFSLGELVSRHFANRTCVVEQRTSQSANCLRDLMPKHGFEREGADSREWMPDGALDERGNVFRLSASEKGHRSRDCDRGIGIAQRREQQMLAVVWSKGEHDAKRGAPDGELTVRERGGQERTDFGVEKEQVDTVSQSSEVCLAALSGSQTIEESERPQPM